jgi:hypothetical protein
LSIKYSGQILMKRLLCIFLLFVVLFQTTNRLWIIVSFYAQREYIAKNICVNRYKEVATCGGNCFLSKQIKENESREERFPDLRQKEVHVFFIENLYIIEFSSIIHIPQKAIPAYKTRFLSLFKIPVFHPPQFA